VITATSVAHTLFVDKDVEDAAKLWKFAPATDCKEARVVREEFIFNLFPKGTPKDQLTTVFFPPYKVEVRHEVFDPVENIDPSPDPIKPKRKKSGSENK
jgi:hypothetical protein